MTPLPPRAKRGALSKLFRGLFREHVFGSLAIVLAATWIISDQVESRDDFASAALTKDVESRWGAPVDQPAPSLRYVESGSIFTELKPLAFDSQHVRVDAGMNYRKRGLRYFSGFDFTLSADYAVTNREAHDIDVAFVFPIEVDKSQVLLSELGFSVDGQPAQLDLGDAGNRLMWTGRVAQGAVRAFHIQYRARGLNAFVYRLDPSLPARDVKLDVEARGGDNFDYPPGVLSATTASQTDRAVTLHWAYPSLESGVALGVILPSEKRFDAVIATMARRAWAPFLAWMGIVAALAARHRRPLAFYESYLLAAAYGFSFVLLSYLAAFMSFYAAYAAVMLGMGLIATAYSKRIFVAERLPALAGAWVAAMAVPTAAVIWTGYTGLIYTLEILAALLGAMALSTRPAVRAFLSDVLNRESPPTPVPSPAGVG
jgi:hypothetical protein